MQRFFAVVVLFASPLAVAQIEFVAPKPMVAYINSGYGRIDLASASPGVWLVAAGLSPRAPGASSADVSVLRSLDDGASWNPLVLLDTSLAHNPADDCEPVIACDHAGTCVVAWAAESGLAGLLPDVFYSTTKDYGNTWTAPEAFDETPALDLTDNELPSITTDNSGTWIVLWKSIAANYSVSFVRSTDNATTWSRPAPLWSSPTAEPGPEDAHAATDGAGNWVVTSTKRHAGNEDYDIFAMHSNDSGARWSGETQITNDTRFDPRNDVNSTVIFDATRGWLVWWESNLMDWSTMAVLCSRSTDGGVSWSAPEAFPTPPPANNFVIRSRPIIATGNNGRWAALWGASEAFRGLVQTYYSHSENSGENWTIPVPIEPPTFLPTGPSAIVSDGQDQWIAAWLQGGFSFDAPVTAYSAIGRIYTGYAPSEPSRDVGGESVGTCFVATAAYGTPLAPQLNALRDLRDQILLANVPGTAFVDTYYRLSPPAAAWISVHPLGKSVVRFTLGLVLAFGRHWMACIVGFGALVASGNPRTARKESLDPRRSNSS